MLDADRVFLNDLFNLTFKNHMMAVDALLYAGANAKEFATRHLRKLEPHLTEAEAVALEAQTNEGARFQATMFAKIFAEYVATVEDFGALCSAIRHRGILNRYFKSGVGEVGGFFDHVLQHPGEDLGALLNLPDLASIQPRVTPELFANVSGHYADMPKHIAQIATAYRLPPDPAVLFNLSNLPADWREQVIILLDVDGSAPASTKGIAPQVFNKIKHRFMLIEAADQYAALPGASQYHVVAIGKTQPKVKKLVDAVHVVSMGAAEIAATMLALDRAGIIV